MAGRRQRHELEALEPRILLSADALSVGAGDPPPQASAFSAIEETMAPLDASGSFQQSSQDSFASLGAGIDELFGANLGSEEPNDRLAVDGRSGGPDAPTESKGDIENAAGETTADAGVGDESAGAQTDREDARGQGAEDAESCVAEARTTLMFADRPVSPMQAVGLAPVIHLTVQQLVTTLRSANGPPSQFVDNQALIAVDTASAPEVSPRGVFVSPETSKALTHTVAVPAEGENALGADAEGVLPALPAVGAGLPGHGSLTSEVPSADARMGLLEGWTRWPVASVGLPALPPLPPPAPPTPPDLDLSGPANDGLTITIQLHADGTMDVSGSGSGDDGLGFVGITNIIGNALADITLIGPDVTTDWVLSGPNSGSVSPNGSATVTFSEVDTLRGGSGADRFEVGAGYTLAATIEGGAGTTRC